MGTISLLENVACVKFWNSVLHDVVVWESTTVMDGDETCVVNWHDDTRFWIWMIAEFL